MSTFRIDTQKAQAIYDQLQDIANQVQDDPTSNSTTDNKSVFDRTLSNDDMTSAIVKHIVDRSALRFTDVRENGESTTYSSFNDLVLLFRGLQWVDEKDGAFDGNIVSSEIYLDIPAIEDLVRYRLDQKRNSVFSVKVKSRSGNSWNGTSWILSKEQLSDGRHKYELISNAHVFDDEFQEEIEFKIWNSDNTKFYEANLIGVDHLTDVALLTITTEDDLTILETSTYPLQTSDSTVIIGNQNARGIVYTEGQINSPNAYFSENKFPVIQHDANSTSGNSGSPMFNSEGEVIGMHFQSDKQTHAIVGYSIPINVVLKSADAIRSKGQSNHGGTIEAAYATLDTTDLANVGIDSDSGYYVKRVSKGSAEYKAGLRAGHIILEVNDEPVDSSYWQKTESWIFDLPPESSVSYTVTTITSPNDREILEFTKNPFYQGQVQSWMTPLGLTVTDIGPTIKNQIAPEHTEALYGVRLVLFKDQIKSFPGLKHNIIITSLNGITFNGLEEFKELLVSELSKNKPIIARVYGIQGSEIFESHFAHLLLNGIKEDRVEYIEPFGMDVIELNNDEQTSFDIPAEYKSAYIVTSRYKRHDDPEHGPVLEGDILLAMNGKSLLNTDRSIFKKRDLQDFHKSYAKKNTVTWILMRNGEILEVVQKIETKQPEENKVIDPYHYKGSTITPEIAERLGLSKDTKGVYIQLDPQQEDKPHPYMFESRMIISSANGVEISDKEELERQIQIAKETKIPLICEVTGSYHYWAPETRHLAISRVFVEE